MPEWLTELDRKLNLDTWFWWCLNLTTDKRKRTQQMKKKYCCDQDLKIFNNIEQEFKIFSSTSKRELREIRNFKRHKKFLLCFTPSEPKDFNFGTTLRVPLDRLCSIPAFIKYLLMSLSNLRSEYSALCTISQISYVQKLFLRTNLCIRASIF